MPHRRRRRRPVLRVILVAELVVALVTGLTVTLAYSEVDRGIEEGPGIEHEVDRKQPVHDTSELNILVLGTDRRDCVDCGVDAESGGGGSDTTILLHVADGRESAYGISIPRDTLVDRPECVVGGEPGGEIVPAEQDATWNEALALAGPQCTAAQLEATTGIYVDSYVVLDFGGFKDMVDAIDGVEVCIPEPIADDKAKIYFDAGTQTLDGDLSLDYVRQRSSTPNSDLGRMKRQQAFMASMIGKVLTAGTLTRPDKLYSFARALTGSLQTSPDLASAGKLVQLAESLQHADLRDIRFVTAPTAEFPREDPNWGRLELTEDAEKLWRKVIADEPLGRLGKGAVSGRNPGGSPEDAAENGLCG
ncbi:LCP family protein [Nocardioides ferulae]|uniref:LCP family protein n=1 Tax=Nocardioides ferulae TaxID=2340821 RepID=UPI000EB31494|nr:LCP family protein [Nocardioides ferulae]